MKVIIIIMHLYSAEYPLWPVLSGAVYRKDISKIIEKDKHN